MKSGFPGARAIFAVSALVPGLVPIGVGVGLGAVAVGFSACSGGSNNLTGSSSGAGGAAAACVPCLQNSNCAAGNDCAQFAGDQYCAPDCATAACGDGQTCMSLPGADGHSYQVCVPNSNVCGGLSTSGAGGATTTSATSTSATTTSTTSTSSSTSSGGTCAHSPCASGTALVSGCNPCATQVCASDSYCCNKSWDNECVTEAMSASGASCGGGSTSSSTSTSSTTSSTSSSTSSGGPVSALSFAVVGDTRPPNEDDTAGYPTAVITKIWQDVEAASPRPAFVITTGDYMFASPSHTPGTQATQMGYYLTARAAFSGPVYPAMGNHECDGATADNCYACGTACSKVGGTCVGSVCQTPNLSVFLSKMLAPVGQSLPYYSINVNGTGNAWTSKFVFIACNAWSPAQATWLTSTLSVPTTYTFVVRHESPGTSGAPCVTASPSADSITTAHPFTLIIAGHTHTYAYYASEKLVVVGNGGAPLSNSVNYGYVLAQQSGSSIVFTEHDYATNTVNQTFTVQ